MLVFFALDDSTREYQRILVVSFHPQKRESVSPIVHLGPFGIFFFASLFTFPLFSLLDSVFRV